MDVDCLDLLAQELGFVSKSEQMEALELLLRGKDVFCVLPAALFIRCLFMQRVQVPVQRPTVIFYLACVKKRRSVDNTRPLPHVKIIVFFVG